VILYEMLTGIVPFDDPSTASVALMHLSEPPPSPCAVNPDLNQATEQVLFKGLEKEPDDRYHTGKALMDALEKALKAPKVAPAKRGLPPPPPGMERPQRELSQMSIADKVAFDQVARTTPSATRIGPKRAQHRPDPRTAPALTKKGVYTAEMEQVDAVKKPATVAQTPGSSFLLVAAIAVVTVVVVIGLVMMLLGGGDDESDATLPTRVVVASPTVIPPTDVPTIAVEAATEMPTDLPAPTLPPPTFTLTPIPTVIPPTDVPPTSIPLPTFTPIPPTDIPPPVAVPTEPPPPTVMYPNGHLLLLFYDASNFYLQNASGESVRTSPLSFEALHSSGTTLAYAFDGGRWAQFYGYVESGRCVSIESSSSSSKPRQCTGFNAEVYTTSGSELVFWMARDGATQFRVLWDDQEVARCELAAGYCEVLVP
jgi:hypothetical protein